MSDRMPAEWAPHGSEPDHPDFDTAPLWRQVIVGNGIANGTFMVVPTAGVTRD